MKGKVFWFVLFSMLSTCNNQNSGEKPVFNHDFLSFGFEFERKQSVKQTISIVITDDKGFYSVLTSIHNYYSLKESWKWRGTYVLQIRHSSSANFFQTNRRSLETLDLKWIDISSHVFLLFNRDNTLYEIYFSLRGTSFLRRVEVEVGLTLENIASDSVVRRRKDFMGELVNGVTQDDKDLQLVARFENSTSAKFIDGLSVYYFQLMADGLNFSVGAVRGTGWIQQGPNNTLLGMAQQLYSGEADVLIAHSELLPYRLRDLRFIHPYYRGKVRAFFKQPEISKIRNIFFNPLQPQLWACLFFLWLFIVSSLIAANAIKRGNSRWTWIWTKIAPFHYQNQKRKHSSNGSDGQNGILGQFYECQVVEEDLRQDDRIIAEDAFLWAVSCACGQGWHMLPHSGSMKLIMFSGLITYIFSYTAYSAAIITSLSIFLIPIKTWSDLSSSGYTIYGDPLLQTSSNITRNKLLNISDALSILQNKKHASIAVISVYDQFYQIAYKNNYTHDFLCKKVSKVNVDGQVVKGGMIVDKNSPYKKFFNFVTLLIRERGLDSRISHHYSYRWSPGCLQKNEYAVHSYILEIKDVFTAFAILLFGFVASICFIFLERLSIHGTYGDYDYPSLSKSSKENKFQGFLNRARNKIWTIFGYFLRK